MLQNVLLYLVKIVTADMYQLVALGALQMKMMHTSRMSTVILIAGRLVGT